MDDVNSSLQICTTTNQSSIVEVEEKQKKVWAFLFDALDKWKEHKREQK